MFSLIRKMMTGSESRNTTFTANKRKNLKSTSSSSTTPCISCLRTCAKTPSTLVNIYNDSPGLRSLIKWLFSVSLSLSLLFVIPLSFYTAKSSTFLDPLYIFRTVKEVYVGWASLLAISPLFVTTLSSIVGFSLARKCHLSKMGDTDTVGSSSHGSDCNESPMSHHPSSTRHSLTKTMTYCTKTKTIGILKRPGYRKLIYVIGLALAVAALISLQSTLHMRWPSWIWNPFLFPYNVYWPPSIADATKGICIEEEIDDQLQTTNSNANQAYNIRKGISRMGPPLCLPEKSWRSLSTDTLSSKNDDDVNSVIDGVRYLKNKSGGIAFGIMSRDTVNAIEPLRQNVEGLLPFTSNLSVVVFENDSTDGTREAFLNWAKEVEGKYTVDVIQCEDSPDCRFNASHRDFEKDVSYERTSAVGRMGEFRQRLIDHILQQKKYADYSHFLVLDIDLSVSISPFGVLHSIGKLPDEAIASSGRQPRPGSLGSLVPPYDFSAFVAHETATNKRMLKFNELFCGLKPEGYRWRNECMALSVTQFMMIQIADRLNDGEPYLVDSAFNGAVLYPLKLIRESKAKYDAGKDGQRCEHIGFNLSFKRPMYINPKWNMNLHPHLMGGPSGKRAVRTINDITKSPVIGPVVIGQTMLSMIIFVYCTITLTMLTVYPFWVCVSRSRKNNGGSDYFPASSSNSAFARDRSKSPSLQEMEFLLDPCLSIPSRKRKGSEFEKEMGSIQVISEQSRKNIA